MKSRVKVVLNLMLVSLALVLVLGGCTKKDNLTGDNWSGLSPRIARADSFSLGYSYTHTGSVKGTESYLLCGSEDGIEAVALMRWTGLKDSLTFVESPVLKLVATRRSALARNPLVLSFHKLNKNWAADSTDLVLDTDITALAMPDFPITDSIATAGDTISINIPNSIIQNWKTVNVTGFNLALKAATGSWMEFKSAGLSGYGPLLTFKYRVPSDTTVYSYSSRPDQDSYRITGSQTEVVSNTWNLKNLKPQRMYVRFELNESIFTDGNNQVLSDLDRRRMTVNKAELVLFVKNNPYYTSTPCYLYPFNVTRDTLVTASALTDSDLENINHTYSTGTIVNRDSVKVDITALVQAFTSEDKQNKGIVIRSTAEMLNYGNLEFWHFTDAPVGKKPYVRIYYTTPFLK